MAEPFYRLGEWIVPPVVAMNGTKFTFRGLENIPAAGRRATRAEPHQLPGLAAAVVRRRASAAGGCTS